MELAITAIGCFLFALVMINVAIALFVFKLCAAITAELKR